MIPYESGQTLGDIGAEMLADVLEAPAFQKSIEGAVVKSLDAPEVQGAIVRAAAPVLAQAALWVGGAVLLALLLGRRT